MLWQSEQETSLILCVLAFQLWRLNVAFAVWHLRQMRDLAGAGRFLRSIRVSYLHFVSIPFSLSCLTFSSVSPSMARLPGPWHDSQSTSGMPDFKESWAPMVLASKSRRFL